MTRCARAALAGALIAVALPGPAEALEWPGVAASVAARLEDPDPVVRAAAVAAIADLGSIEARALVAAAALDRAEPVRVALAERLATPDAAAHEAIAVALLGDRRPPVRAAAATALGAMRSRGALDPLVRALTDPDAGVRTAAVEALARLGRPEAVLALIEVTNDPARDVAVAAIEALGTLGDPAAVYAVLEKLHDPVEAVAVAAAEALGALRADEAVPALIELVETGRPAEAEAAVEALGAMRTRRATPLLLGLLETAPDGGVRDAAIDGLLAISDPAAAPALALLAARDPDAGDLVAELGPAAWDALAGAWTSRGPANGGAVLRAWLRSGDPRALDVLDASDVVAGDDPVAAGEWYRLSPTERGFCTGWRLSGEPVDAPGWEMLLAEAVAARATACLEELLASDDAIAAVGATEAARVLAAVGANAPALVFERVGVDGLDYADAVRLAEVASTFGASGAPLLLRLMRSADARVRREAGWWASELPTGSWPDGALVELLDAVERAPELVPALTGAAFANDPEVVAALDSWARDGGDALRAEALRLVGLRCGARASELVAAAVVSDDLWVRYAAGRAAEHCGLALPAGAMLRAGLAEVAVRIDPPSPESAPDVDALRAQTRDANEAARAAAWLALARAGSAPSGRELALVAAASDSALELDVLALVAAHAAEGEALDRIRALAPASIAGWLEPGEGGARHATPLHVQLVDPRSGEARVWQPVVVVFADLTAQVVRTDQLGRVDIVRGDVVAVHPVAAAP